LSLAPKIEGKQVSRKKKPKLHPNFRTALNTQIAEVTASRVRSGVSIVGISIVVSFIVHALIYSTFAVYNSTPKKEVPKPVSVRIIPKEKKVVVAEPIPEPPPPEPKPKVKPKPTEKKVSSERKPKEAPVKPVAPVQGLAPDALSPDGKGIAVPVGNTLMVADEGKRLQEVQPLSNEDLSADAKLIRNSIVIPAYTEAAIDAGLEGSFVVDVYVDAKGVVTSAELSKKVGYGMDVPLTNAALKARFEPRKDRYGQAQAGWATISFRLELP
jgi:TonB family protein